MGASRATLYDLESMPIEDASFVARGRMGASRTALYQPRNYANRGVIHLQSPDAFLPTMPDWVAAPREVILFTGVRNCRGARAADTFVSMVGCGDARPVCCLRFPRERQARV
jgi:hypothetical protein